MMKKLPLVTLLVALLVLGCQNDEVRVSSLDESLQRTLKLAAPNKDASYWVLPSKDELAKIPQDPKNPLTPEKVALGKFLFYETGLANKPLRPESFGTYSCSSCHVPEAGFKPGRMQGIGDGGMGFGTLGETRLKHPNYEEKDMDVQGLRAMSIVNVAYAAENTQWNGQFGSYGANEGTEERWELPQFEINRDGFQGLELQLQEGLKVHRMSVDEQVVTDLGYKSYYDAAFQDVPAEERYSGFTTAMAVASYLRTVVADEAPFQQWLKGNFEAMTDKEKEGAIVFFGKAHCSSCHSSPGLNAAKFFAVGVNDLSDLASYNEIPGSQNLDKNQGRGKYTGKEEDYFKFKVPTLYNLEGTPFFFHGSSKRTLEEVVDYFNDAVPENPRVPKDRIASDFKPLYLTDREKNALVQFLRTGLFDKNYLKHVPTDMPSGNNCFPNADPRSLRDTGCN